jgi:hypothetical protein
MRLRLPISAALCAAFLATAHANSAGDRLAQMPEASRALALAGAIQSNGERCPGVVATFLQGTDRRGNALWNARCTNSESYVVQVNNDPSGSMRVTNCKVALSTNATPCFSRMR